MTYKTRFIGVTFTALLMAVGSAQAGQPDFGSNTVTAKPSNQMTNMTMTVSGPNGYYSQKHSTFGAPTMSLYKNGGLADGIYKWELSGSTSQLENANPMGLDFGRGDSQRQFVKKSRTESGTFRVANGVIVAPDASMTEEKSPRRKLPAFSKRHK